MQKQFIKDNLLNYYIGIANQEEKKELEEFQSDFETRKQKDFTLTHLIRDKESGKYIFYDKKRMM